MQVINQEINVKELGKSMQENMIDRIINKN